MCGGQKPYWIMYSPPGRNSLCNFVLKIPKLFEFTVSAGSRFQLLATRWLKKYFLMLSLECSLKIFMLWPRVLLFLILNSFAASIFEKFFMILKVSIKSYLFLLFSRQLHTFSRSSYVKFLISLIILVARLCTFSIF